MRKNLEKLIGGVKFPILFYTKEMILEEQIEQIVQEYFQLLGREDCFIVDIILKGNKLEIYIDSDDAIDFEICRKVSREVEKFLDEGLPLGEDYLLEVSSPGLSRPLKLPRQFKKNIGREVTVLAADKSRQKGILTSADDDHFQITFTVSRKEGKKKISEEQTLTIPYNEGRKVTINIKF
ncbi:MAG: ribosome maturation factor RimP [Saprospiraceae bacterium]|nr:ribosome maturation factor RimP [Saprospiraceae bacterium]HMT77097.1 ribosome maturation factor RimP [Saprospiraceae bacterium]HQU96527.1 ribosome maturation factor RimP [Saprospiraceae bacterium]HQW96848.1 ribosome maturation factor RimP [Saprospiraceae bacterium]